MRGFLAISPEARDFLLRARPELAGAFQLDDRIPIDKLLTPASNPPTGPFSRTLVSRASPRAALPPLDSATPNSKLQTPNSELQTAPQALGDFLAALLHRLRIDKLLAQLQRRGLLANCGCAARQARLNALSPRLRAQLEPWPLTLAMLLSWLLLAFVLLVR